MKFFRVILVRGIWEAEILEKLLNSGYEVRSRTIFRERRGIFNGDERIIFELELSEKRKSEVLQNQNAILERNARSYENGAVAV